MDISAKKNTPDINIKGDASTRQECQNIYTDSM